MEDTRIINLFDDDTNFLVKTNAPEEEIRKGIEEIIYVDDFE